MQVRTPWFGKNRELHGIWVGDELEISYRARRGKRTLRLIPTPDGVRVVSTLPDDLRAETHISPRADAPPVGDCG